MQELKNSSSYSVFKNFEDINQIPRCSNDEEKISEFMYQFGKKLGFETTKDHVGNVIIIKPATKGYENHDTVTLQSHVDMVCVKDDDSNHDFTCDPIEMIIDGDFIKANKTTLGADDGIGVALTMAILEDDTLEHPQIEALFTTTEETGMDGVIGLSEEALIGKKLINLDNEEDWKVFVGCAGGAGARLTKEFNRIKVENTKNYELRLTGLQGGHSGSMIHENRMNANKELASIVNKLKNEFNLYISSIKGGIKQNAIPANAIYELAVDIDEANEFEDKFEKLKYEFVEKGLKREPDLNLSLISTGKELDFFDEDSQAKILRSIQLLPHGVNTMDKELDIVKSSDNVAIIETNKENIEILISIRSSDPDDMKDLSNRISEIAKNNEFEIELRDRYPIWKPKFDSELLDVTKKVYKDLTNDEIEVAVIHAGLETGTLSEKYPDVEMISIGPTTHGAHTPLERVSIKSVEFVFNYLKELLKNL